MWHDTINDFDAALGNSALPVPAGIAGEKSRFDIYRNNVAVSLGEALADTFPVVKKIVGDDFFSAMAQSYILENKPASPVLFEYGASFADFIEAFEPAKGLPYLSDVAGLERAWLDAYHAADKRPLGIDALAAVPEDKLEGLRFDLHPSLSLRQSAYPAAAIWLAHQDTDAPDLSAIAWQPSAAVILRPELDVQVTQVSGAAFDFLAALQTGESLGAACAMLSENTDADPSRELTALFEMGAVVGFAHRNI